VREVNLIHPAAIEIDGQYLTDHNRSEVSCSNSRITNDVRTQFGTLRRYYKADKKSWSVSWDMIPHTYRDTVDRKLGAEDMIDLFKLKSGAVEVVFHYDNRDEDTFTAVITDFSSSLLKRWDDYRFYSVSLTLEEV
jgi:hypothetical protein